jgi:phosphoribosylanthranilate isomerase
MIFVKICGITRPEDAALAAELGARAIGLVFWPESPRAIDRVRAREIVASLPAGVDAIGVFVNQTEAAIEIAHEVGLSAIQLHGDEPPGSYGQLASPGNGVAVIKAIAVRDDSAVGQAMDVPPGARVLLDAHDAVKRGGTGRTIDWSLAARIARQRPVILSGGLNAANVVEAIEAVRPIAIDVSSGVESEPGKKDSAKLRALFGIIRTSGLSSQHSPFGIQHSS